MKKNIFLLKRALLSFIMTLALGAHCALASVDLPQFSLEGVSERRLFSNEDYGDKVLLVTFFATWCPPCIEEAASLNALHEELKDEPFAVLAISVDQGGPEAVQAFIKEHGINYPVAMFNNEVIRDFGGVYGIPVSFLVNKKSQVVKRYAGYVPESLLKRDIESLL